MILKCGHYILISVTPYLEDEAGTEGMRSNPHPWSLVRCGNDGAGQPITIEMERCHVECFLKTFRLDLICLLINKTN